MNENKFPSVTELEKEYYNDSIRILENIFSQIIENHKDNIRSFNYVYGDYTHFPNEDYILDFIRKKGYSIIWNSPCLWYEISW